MDRPIKNSYRILHAVPLPMEFAEIGKARVRIVNAPGGGAQFKLCERSYTHVCALVREAEMRHVFPALFSRLPRGRTLSLVYTNLKII